MYVSTETIACFLHMDQITLIINHSFNAPNHTKCYCHSNLTQPYHPVSDFTFAILFASSYLWKKKHLSKADQVSGQSKVCVTEKTSVATSNSLSASIFLSQWIYGQSVIGFSKAYSCHGMRLPSPFSDNTSSRSQSLIIIIALFLADQEKHTLKKIIRIQKSPTPPSPKGALVAFL